MAIPWSAPVYSRKNRSRRNEIRHQNKLQNEVPSTTLNVSSRFFLRTLYEVWQLLTDANSDDIDSSMRRGSDRHKEELETTTDTSEDENDASSSSEDNTSYYTPVSSSSTGSTEDEEEKVHRDNKPDICHVTEKLTEEASPDILRSHHASPYAVTSTSNIAEASHPDLIPNCSSQETVTCSPVWWRSRGKCSSNPSNPHYHTYSANYHYNITKKTCTESLGGKTCTCHQTRARRNQSDSITWAKAGENLSKIATRWDRRNSLPENTRGISDTKTQSHERRNVIAPVELKAPNDLKENKSSSSKSSRVPERRVNFSERRMSLPNRRRSQPEGRENLSLPNRRRSQPEGRENLSKMRRKSISLDRRVSLPDMRGLRHNSEPGMRHGESTNLLSGIARVVSAVGVYIIARKIESFLK